MSRNSFYESREKTDAKSRKNEIQTPRTQVVTPIMRDYSHQRPNSSSASDTPSSQYWRPVVSSSSISNDDVLQEYSKCMANISALSGASSSSSSSSTRTIDAGPSRAATGRERHTAGGASGCLDASGGGMGSGGDVGGDIFITPPLRSLMALSSPAVKGASPSLKAPPFLRTIADIMFSIKITPFTDNAKIVQNAFESSPVNLRKDLRFEDGQFFVTLGLDEIIIATAKGKWRIVSQLCKLL